MKRTILACIVAGSLVLLSACSREPEQPSASAPSAAPKEPRVENISLGTSLGPHGGIAYGAYQSDFGPGELIYLAMEVKDAPPGTSIRVVWKGPAGDALGEETKQVRPGQDFVNFAADSANLLVGQGYEVEIYVNGKLASSRKFNVVLSTG